MICGELWGSEKRGDPLTLRQFLTEEMRENLKEELIF